MHLEGALAVGQRHRPRLRRLERRVGEDLHPAATQLAGRELGQAGGCLGHHPVARLHEHEAGAGHAAARVAGDHVGHVVLQLGDPLEARVAGSDEDDREVLPARLLVGKGLGDLQVEQSAVPDADRSTLKRPEVAASELLDAIAETLEMKEVA